MDGLVRRPRDRRRRSWREIGKEILVYAPYTIETGLSSNGQDASLTRLRLEFDSPQAHHDKSTTKVEFDFEQILSTLDDTSNRLSKWQVEKLRKRLRENYERRFKRPKEPKYGSISRAFTELELQHFLGNVPNEKFRLFFKYQAYLGLRIGEVCKLHISNIDFDKRELTLNTEKSHKIDTLRIPEELFKETVLYVNGNIASVKAARGYIFFKDASAHKKNKTLCLDMDYARNMFRRAAQAARLDQIYAYSEERNGRKERRLYKLTSHSLRHYAITKFSKSTNGNVVLTSRFARHSDPGTTMRYIAKDNADLFQNIDLAFSNKIKEMTESFKR